MTPSRLCFTRSQTAAEPVAMRILAKRVPLIAAFLAATACRSGTAPTPLTGQLELVQFATEAERLAWPTTPSVQGGPTLTVRGVAFFGCGDPEAVATQAGAIVDVRVRIAPGSDQRPCLAVVAGWRAFRAEVLGLEPGDYGVRAFAAGHDGAAAFQIHIEPGLR